MSQPVEKPEVEKADNEDYLYMIRENHSMEYVAIITPESIGTSKLGKRAVHWRDESVAKEQCRLLNEEPHGRHYVVIVSQTSVGIR